MHRCRFALWTAINHILKLFCWIGRATCRWQWVWIFHHEIIKSGVWLIPTINLLLSHHEPTFDFFISAFSWPFIATTLISVLESRAVVRDLLKHGIKENRRNTFQDEICDMSILGFYCCCCHRHCCCCCYHFWQFAVFDGNHKPQARHIWKEKKWKKYASNIVFSAHVRDRKLYHQLEAADGREQWKKKPAEIEFTQTD